MKITESEQVVLAAAELRAEVGVNELAKETGLRPHTITYALAQLERKNIVRKTPFIDAYPLGYSDYALYFSLTSNEQKTNDALIHEMLRSPHVSWLAELGGEYQYGAAIYAKNAREVTDFLDALSAQFGDVFFAKSLNIRVSFTQFQRKYLLDQPPKNLPSVSFGNTTPIQTDTTDRNILSVLANQNPHSKNEIARLLHLPVSTVYVRLKKLVERNLITGYTYAVDSQKLGMQSFDLLIHAKGVHQTLNDDLYNFARVHPNVFHFLRCLGEWDYEMGVDVEKAEDITKVVQELSRRFGNNILTVKILPMFRYLKLSYYPFALEKT